MTGADRPSGPAHRRDRRSGERIGAGPPKHDSWWRRANAVRKGVSKRSKAATLGLVAAGVAFYAMLAVFPAIIAVVSIYALVANPSDIAHQLEPVTRALPPGGADLVVNQLTSAARASHGGVSIGVIVGLLATIFAASGGVRGLMIGLNVIFERTESRNFAKVRAFALGLTIGALVLAAVMLGLVTAFPVVLDHIGLDAAAAVLAQVGRWVALFVLATVSLALFYRYGPDRGTGARPRVTAGVLIAIVIWLVGSVLFSLYVSNFGSYNKTYGALAAVVVLLLWLYLSAYAVLYGAAVDAELAARSASERPEPSHG
jgi:membrane protein